MKKKLFKLISLLLCFCFFFEQTGLAQVSGQLDISGHFAQLRNQIVQEKFRPLHLRYLSYDNQNNNFNLLLDKGDARNLKKAVLEDTTKTLLNYFFVGISLPNDSFWVNLRPDAEDNIIDPLLAKTDLGRVLLEADLQLKKDTAQCTSPETPEGKEYWDKLYKKAGELLGADNITIPTLTRPWIIPHEIIIRETNDNAYIYKATLKVMLEQDYLKGSAVYNFEDDRLKALNEYASELIREKILPKITKDVNTAKRYAPLRQVYYSLIMAQWFKARFYGKGGLYSWMIDKKNLNGLTSRSPWSKSTYFKDYQRSFKDGEYNLKVPVSTPMGQSIRSYFSGGMNLTDFQVPAPGVSSPVVSSIVGHSRAGSSPLARFNDKGISFFAEGGTPENPAVRIELKSDIPVFTEQVGSAPQEGNVRPSAIARAPVGQTSQPQSASPLSKITKSIIALAIAGVVFSQGIVPLGQKVWDSFMKPAARQESIVTKPIPKPPASQAVAPATSEIKFNNIDPAVIQRSRAVTGVVRNRLPRLAKSVFQNMVEEGQRSNIIHPEISPMHLEIIAGIENTGQVLTATSGKGAKGLMQIREIAFRDLMRYINLLEAKAESDKKNNENKMTAEEKAAYTFLKPFKKYGDMYKRYKKDPKQTDPFGAMMDKLPSRVHYELGAAIYCFPLQKYVNHLSSRFPHLSRMQLSYAIYNAGFGMILNRKIGKETRDYVVIGTVVEASLKESTVTAPVQRKAEVSPVKTAPQSKPTSKLTPPVVKAKTPAVPAHVVKPSAKLPSKAPGKTSLKPTLKAKKSSSPLEKSEVIFSERFGQVVLSALSGYFKVSDFETRLYELIGVKAFMKWLPEYKAQLETRRQEYDSTNLNFNTEEFAEFVKKLPDEYQKIYIVHGPQALMRQLPEEFRAAREQFKRELTVEERKARLEQDLKRVDDRVTKTKAHEVKKLFSFLVFLSPVIAAPFAAVPMTLMSVVILASLSLGNTVFNLYPFLIQRYNRNRAEKNSVWITRELSRLNAQTSGSPMSASADNLGPIVESRMASPGGTWGEGVVLSAAEQRKVAQEAEKVTQFLVKYKPDIVNDILEKLNLNFTFADITKLSIGYLASGANKHAFKVDIVNKDGAYKSFSVALKLPAQNEAMFEEGEEDVLNDLWGTGFVPNLGKVFYLRATSSDPAGYEYSETQFDSGEYLTVLVEEFVDGFTLGQVDTLCGLIANNKELSNIVQGMLREGRITIGDAKERVRSALMKIRTVQLMAAKDAALPDFLVELLDALLKWDKDYKILSELEPNKNIITETLAKSVSEFLARYFFVLNKRIILDGRMSLDLHSNNIMLEKATGALRIIDPGKTIQGSLDEFIIEMLFYYGVSPSNVEKILPRLMAFLSAEQKEELKERLDQYQDPRVTNNTVEKLMEEKGSFKKRAKNIADGVRHYFVSGAAEAVTAENRSSGSAVKASSALVAPAQSGMSKFLSAAILAVALLINPVSPLISPVQGQSSGQQTQSAARQYSPSDLKKEWDESLRILDYERARKVWELTLQYVVSPELAEYQGLTLSVQGPNPQGFLDGFKGNILVMTGSRDIIYKGKKLLYVGYVGETGKFAADHDKLRVTSDRKALLVIDENGSLYRVQVTQKRSAGSPVSDPAASPLSRASWYQKTAVLLFSTVLLSISAVGCVPLIKQNQILSVAQRIEVPQQSRVSLEDALNRNIPRIPGLYQVGAFLQGRPTVVFIHGADSNPTYFNKFLTEFQGKFNLAVFTYNFYDKIEDVSALFSRHLSIYTGTEQVNKTVIVAHSYGTKLLREAVLNADSQAAEMFRKIPVVELAATPFGSIKATGASEVFPQITMGLLALVVFQDPREVARVQDPGNTQMNNRGREARFEDSVNSLLSFAVGDDYHAPRTPEYREYLQRAFLLDLGPEGHDSIIDSERLIKTIEKVIITGDFINKNKSVEQGLGLELKSVPLAKDSSSPVDSRRSAGSPVDASLEAAEVSLDWQTFGNFLRGVKVTPDNFMARWGDHLKGVDQLSLNKVLAALKAVKEKLAAKDKLEAYSRDGDVGSAVRYDCWLRNGDVIQWLQEALGKENAVLVNTGKNKGEPGYHAYGLFRVGAQWFIIDAAADQFEPEIERSSEVGLVILPAGRGSLSVSFDGFVSFSEFGKDNPSGLNNEWAFNPGLLSMGDKSSIYGNIPRLEAVQSIDRDVVQKEKAIVAISRLRDLRNEYLEPLFVYDQNSWPLKAMYQGELVKIEQVKRVIDKLEKALARISREYGDLLDTSDREMLKDDIQSLKDYQEALLQQPSLAAGSPVVGEQYEFHYEALMKNARDSAKERKYLYKEPNRKEVGWKLHLNVDDTPVLAQEISAFLTKAGILHKVGKSSGQEGKGMTIYIGPRDAAEDVARRIDRYFGDRLPAAVGDVLVDDTPFSNDAGSTSKIWGRFDEAQASDFHQYGSKGLPYLKVDVNNWIFDARRNEPGRKEQYDREASLRAHERLLKDYGAFYTGTRDLSAEIIFALTPWYLQPEKPVVSPAIMPVGSPLQNKAEGESLQNLMVSKLLVANGLTSFTNKTQETPQIIIPQFGEGYDGADLQFVIFGNLFYEALKVSALFKDEETLRENGFRVVNNLPVRPTYIIVNNEREARAVQMILDAALKKSNGFVFSLINALALKEDNPYNIINLGNEGQGEFTVLGKDGQDVAVEVVKDGENYKFFEGGEARPQEIVSRKRDTATDEHVHKTGDFTEEQLAQYDRRPADKVSVTFMGVNDALSEADVTNFLVNIGKESIFVDPSLEAYASLKEKKLLPSRWILTHNHADHNAGFMQFIIEKFSEAKAEAVKNGSGNDIVSILRNANQEINTIDLIMTQEVKEELIELIAAYLLGGESFENKSLEEAQGLSRQWARDLLENEKIDRAFEKNGLDEITFIDKELDATIVFRNHKSHPIATYGFVITSGKGNLGYVVDTGAMDDFTWAADQLKTYDPRGESSILISENGVSGIHLTVDQLQNAVEGSGFLQALGSQGQILLVHSKDSGAVEVGAGAGQTKVSEWLKRAERFSTRSAGSPLVHGSLTSPSVREKERLQKYYPRLEALMVDIRSAASVDDLLQAKTRFDDLRNDIKNNEGNDYDTMIQSLELRYLVHQDMFNDAIKEKIVNGFIEQSYMKKRFALTGSEIRVYKWLKSLLAVYDLRYDTQSKQLRDLNQVYDIAIGIAAAGAFTAALFDLMGLPTTLADVHVNGDTQMSRADFAWRKDSRTGGMINPEELRGKKVIICENDINTGATLDKFLNELSAYEPGQVDIVFDLRGGTFFINKENITKLQEKYAFFKNVHFMRLDTEINLSMLSEVIGLVADALQRAESFGPGTAAAGSPIASGYVSRILRRPVGQVKQEILALEKIIDENGYQVVGGVNDLEAYRLLMILTGKGVIARNKAVYSPVNDYGLSLHSSRFIQSPRAMAAVARHLRAAGRDDIRVLVVGSGTGVDVLTAYAWAKSNDLKIHLDTIDILQEAVDNTVFNLDLLFPGSRNSEVFVHKVERGREFDMLSGEYDFVYFNSPNTVYDSQVKFDGAHEIGATDYKRLLSGIESHLSSIGIALIANTVDSRKFFVRGLKVIQLVVNDWDVDTSNRTMFTMFRTDSVYSSSPMVEAGNTEFLEGVTFEEEAAVKAKIGQMLAFTKGQLDSSDPIARSSASNFVTVFSGDNLLRAGQLILEKARQFLKDLGVSDPGEMRLYMTGGRLKNKGFKGEYDSSFSDIDIAVYVENHQEVARLIDNYDYSVAPYKFLNSFPAILNSTCNILTDELRAREELQEDQIFPGIFSFLHNEWGKFSDLKLQAPYMLIGRISADPDNGPPPIFVLSENRSAGSPVSNVPSLEVLMEEFKEFGSLFHTVEKNGVPARLGLFEDTQAALSGHQEWLIRWVHGNEEVNLRKADTDENMVKLFQQFLEVGLSQGPESVGKIMQEAGGEQRQEGQIKSVTEQLKLTPDIVPPDQAQIIGQKPGMANLITCMAVAGYNTRTADVALAHLAPMSEKTQTYIKRVLGPFMNSSDWHAFIVYPANEIAGVLNVSDIEKYLNSAGVKVIEKIPYAENAVDVMVDPQGQGEVRNVLNKELVGAFELKKSGSSIQPMSSSPLKKGGIDMRALPIVTQPMNTPGMSVMPPLSRLENVNLDEEWQQIQSMIQAGIIPASDRIKEYLQACCFKDDINPQVEKVLACIADILRLEEEQLKPTEAALRDFLALLESDKPAGDLQVALGRIAFTAKEPVTIEQ